MTFKTNKADRVPVFLRVRLPVRCQEKADRYFVAVTGPGLQLGFWDYNRAPRMTCTGDGVWIKHLWIEKNSMLTYNYVLINSRTNETMEVEKLNRRSVIIKTKPCSIDDIYNISSPIQTHDDWTPKTTLPVGNDTNYYAMTSRGSIFKLDDLTQIGLQNNTPREESFEDTQESNRIVSRLLSSQTNSINPYPYALARVRERQEERNNAIAPRTQENIAIAPRTQGINAIAPRTQENIAIAPRTQDPDRRGEINQIKQNDIKPIEHIQVKENEERICANCTCADATMEQNDENGRPDPSKHNRHMKYIRTACKIGITVAAMTYVVSVIFRRIKSS